MKKFLAISFIFVLVTSLGLAVVGIVDEEDKDPYMVYATGIPDDIPTSGNQRNRALDDLQTRTNEAIRELVGDKNSKNNRGSRRRGENEFKNAIIKWQKCRN
jgi:hypothetical protein